MLENLIRFDKKSRFLFIDFETENLCLNECFNKPWQAALISCRGGEIEEKKDLWLRWPDLNFSKGAREIAHSFSEEKMEKTGLSPRFVAQTIKEEIEKSDYIVGHNVLGFDIYVLFSLFNLTETNKPKMPLVFDTLALARGYLNNINYSGGMGDLLFYQYKMLNERIKGSKTKLSDLAEHFGIEYDKDKLHDGLYDLEINVKIWNALKYKIEV
jgi:DNA polymerase III epsilon subunit-like protein